MTKFSRQRKSGLVGDKETSVKKIGEFRQFALRAATGYSGPSTMAKTQVGICSALEHLE